MSLTDLARQTVRAIVDACSRDPELRSRVMADPKAALAEEGVDLPFDKVEAVEDTPETTHVALTDPNADLSDEQMEAVVGGTGMTREAYGNMIAHWNRLQWYNTQRGVPTD